MTPISPSLMHQLVWDYKMTNDEFLQMLNEADNAELTRNQRWAMTRVLERADYYTAMQLIGADRLKQHWLELRPSIRPIHIKAAYDFVVYR